VSYIRNRALSRGIGNDFQQKGNDTTFLDLVIDGGSLELSPRTIGDIKLAKLALIINQVRSADFTRNGTNYFWVCRRMQADDLRHDGMTELAWLESWWVVVSCYGESSLRGVLRPRMRISGLSETWKVAAGGSGSQ
jgi:hypothetical protein